MSPRLLGRSVAFRRANPRLLEHEADLRLGDGFAAHIFLPTIELKKIQSSTRTINPTIFSPSVITSVGGQSLHEAVK